VESHPELVNIILQGQLIEPHAVSFCARMLIGTSMINL
jgi:hypothetical protein